ncbi:MAG TPA: YdcF family protein [Acidimicrobiales bacterium]|nr:YdcF family protein [Acidimicrobiales bacterium]
MRGLRSAGRVGTAAIMLVAVYVLATAGQVLLAARNDDRGPADAIIVLGAAQYDGRPSPALQDRLDHAIALYRDGKAPVVWVTGGRKAGDRFTEASASSRYLIRNGIPNDALELEVQGGNSYESLSAAARYLRDRDQRNVLLVSDPWHAYRIQAIAREVGLRPRFSAAGPRGVTGDTLRRVTYETVAVSVGRIIGYRRLTGLGQRWGSPLTVSLR